MDQEYRISDLGLEQKCVQQCDDAMLECRCRNISISIAIWYALLSICKGWIHFYQFRRTLHFLPGYNNPGTVNA